MESEILNRIQEIKKLYEAKPSSMVLTNAEMTVTTLTTAVIVSLFGKNSHYLDEIKSSKHAGARAYAAYSTLLALEINISSGYITSLIEDAHSDIYAES